jgi:hypothetical protein
VVAHVVIVAGTGATFLTMRIRRGATIADPQVVSTSTVAVVAASGYNFPLIGVDIPPALGEAQWSLTVQQTGASGNAAVQAAAILVFSML